MFHRKILYHEMRHNIDHLSTLWGQEKIIHLHEAISARLAMKEDDFTKIARYKIEEKQFHYDEYFTEQYNNVPYRGVGDEWIWNLSSGTRFNHLGEVLKEQPIMFIKFTSQKGVSINRVPLSIASLLETNAVAEEMIVEQNYLATLAKERQYKEGVKLDLDFARGILYNQSFAIYNAAVHLAANILRIQDKYLAFKIASAVATLALNLSKSLLQLLSIDAEYLKDWGDRPTCFVKNGDHGFIYFTLLLNYKKVFKIEHGYDLRELLFTNNLPEQINLEQTILSMMDKNIDLIKAGTFFNKFFIQQLFQGEKLFEMRGLDGQRQKLVETIVSGVYIPFIVTKDQPIHSKLNFIDILKSNPIPEDVAINDWYCLAGELSCKMEEFYLVRGL